MITSKSKNIFFRYRLIKHLLFWLVYVALNTLMYGQARGDYFIQFQLQLYYLPVVIGATYVTLYFLLPRYLLKKNYKKFIGYFIIMALLFELLQRVNIYLFVLPAYFPNYLNEYKIFSIDVLFRILIEFPVVLVAALIKILSYWYMKEKQNEQLVRQNLEAELKFLKGQIHPHFLFNTLNNLYALTLKKSDSASKMVLKLSDLLKYMLYESNVKKILLEKEIDMIENYIELEKIRYGEVLEVNFNVSGEIAGKQISPLILLPFIENSFKHGVSRQLSDKWVDITVDVYDSSLSMQVLNSKEEINNSKEGDYSEGIGLNNVKRRLELLYPQKHELKVEDSGSEFKVLLKLELANSLSEIKNEN